MKRPIFVLVGVLLLGCLLTYVLIPTVILVRKSIKVENNQYAIQRSLSDSTKWKQWWPGTINDNKLFLGDREYRLTDHSFSSVLLTIMHNNISLNSTLNSIAVSRQSVTLDWTVKMNSSYNPYQRLKTYLYARSISSDFSKVLEAARSHFTNSESVYGLDIKREIVKNPWLISTADSSKGYPSSEKVYSLLATLRAYIANNNALAVDSPMLNIRAIDSTHYVARVAIPTDRKLPSNGKIEYRWMLEGGNILSAEIIGGTKKVDIALEAFEKYVQDYELVAPATPFYSLQTNRLAEKDSSKWVTKIFYPIMYFK